MEAPEDRRRTRAARLHHLPGEKRGLGVQRTTDLIDYKCYIPDIAQAKYEATFSGKGPDLKIGKDHKLANYLGKVLKDGYRSPEAALGEIEADGMEFDTKISPDSLPLCRHGFYSGRLKYGPPS